MTTDVGNQVVDGPALWEKVKCEEERFGYCV